MDPTRLMQINATLTSPDGSTSKDDYNNDVPGVTSTAVKCWVEQVKASESTVDTAQGSETWKLYLPAGCGATKDSTLTIGIKEYEFDGPPWTATNPRTGIATHIEATGRQVR